MIRYSYIANTRELNGYLVAHTWRRYETHDVVSRVNRKLDVALAVTMVVITIALFV